MSIVLVVDDDAATHETARAFCNNNGYRMLSAHNGVEGLRMTVYARPQLLLFEIDLPILDGFSMLRTLQSDRQLATIPAIALAANTGLRSQEYIAMALNQMGCESFLAKPLQATELARAVLRILKSKG